jgi:mono/diheme cytochrome c family protein
MPSDDSTAMSSADFASLVAYLESVPPVDRELAPTRLSVLGKLLMGAGQLPLLTVERIDHSLPPATPTIAVSAEFGGYVARVCTGCHRANLAGGAIPGMPPEFPPAANLTASSRVNEWTLEQLATAVRTGQRPDGSAIAAAHMPWPAFAAMTDTEIAALHAYLQQLPAVPATN